MVEKYGFLQVGDGKESELLNVSIEEHHKQKTPKVEGSDKPRNWEGTYYVKEGPH